MEDQSVQVQPRHLLNSQSVPYLLDIILSGSPQHFKSTLQNAFTKFTRVLLRQRQLAQCQFICKIESCESAVLNEALCTKLSLERTELDPDRIIWVTAATFAKYLIRPGQWVKLCKFPEESMTNNKHSNSREDYYFKCQILSTPMSMSIDEQEADNFIMINAVAEYNLRKSLNIPPFLPIPPLQLKPLLTDPLIKTSNQSLSFSPIHGKSMKLTRLKSSREVSQNEYDVLIEDLFALNCKYLCVGDLISLPIITDANINLLVSEINDKKVGDACKELFKVTRDSSRVSLNSFEAYNQFHLKADDYVMKKVLAPCLAQPFQKIHGWIKQALISNWYSSSSHSDIKGNKFCSELWPNILVYGPIGSGKFSVCQGVASAFGLNFFFINGVNLIGDTSAYTEGKLKAVYDKVANSLCPALIFIKNLHLVGKDKDGNEDKRVILAFKEFLHDIATLSTDPDSLPLHEARNAMTTRAIFIVGSTEYPEKLVPSISQSCLHKLGFSGVVKTIQEVESTLKWFLDKGGVSLEKGVDLNEWTKNNCEGMQKSYGDLKAMAATIVRNAFSQVRPTTKDETSASNTGFQVSSEDLNIGLSTVDTALKKAASTVEVPKVSWDDIGGLDEIQKELINSVKLPLEYPHLFGRGVKRSGILLYGPPGTGKTLIAKAVATEFKLSFLSVKGPELLNMYVGQSEQNVRDVFTKARNAAPCIIFFDELDALAPNRGRAGDSGGVMDRVVSQILAELDGTHSSLGVFVIGATNRPDLIDSALLRPGRFDKLLYVGVSQDHESKLSVLKALTRKFKFDKDVDLLSIASQLPTGMSGADLYSLCSDAYMTAISRNISLVTEGEQQDFLCGVLVNKCDFEAAISRAIPSLSKSEQDKYESLRNQVNR